ncbi:MAG: rane protein [Alphaproteobacteria bacterium]|jgi:hypothetical protein|nr:rane protein [Alphaproteobacteria bacterium]
MSTNRIGHLDPNLIAVCGGALSAALALFPLKFSIISFLITYFAALPLFFVGLCWGFYRLLLGALVAFGIFSARAGMHAGLVFLITTLAPAFLIVYRFQKGDPAGYIVSWVTGLTIAIFLGVLLALSAYSVNVLDLLRSWFSIFADEQAFRNLHEQIIPLLPGISSISWIMMCLVNASLAQRLAVKGHLTQRPYPLPQDSQLYENWDLVLAAGLLLILTDISLFAFMGKNIALMSCVPLFLVGLKVVYAWLKQFDNPKFWVAGVIFMSIFLVWPAMFIVMFGILEPTARLSQRWTPNKS